MNHTLFIPVLNEYLDIFIQKRKLLKKDSPELIKWNEWVEKKYKGALAGILKYNVPK